MKYINASQMHFQIQNVSGKKDLVVQDLFTYKIRENICVYGLWTSFLETLVRSLISGKKQWIFTSVDKAVVYKAVFLLSLCS